VSETGKKMAIQANGGIFLEQGEVSKYRNRRGKENLAVTL